MKRNCLTALFTLCLMLLLLPTSAQAARSYALPDVHKKDTVQWEKLKDVETEKIISFQYEVPKNGAAVLIFYKTTCGNSQAAFRALNLESWVHNECINFYAIENTSHNIADIRAFQKEYAPNIIDSVTWLDSTGSSIDFKYLRAAGMNSSSLTFPVMVVCTEEQGVKTIRAAEIAVTDVRYLGNTLENLLNIDLGVEKPVLLTTSLEENHDLANEALELLNQYRKEQGLYALHPNKKLTELAMLRAAELTIRPSLFNRPDDTYNYDVSWDNLPNITTGNGITALYCDTPEEFLSQILEDSFFEFLLSDDTFTQFGVGCVRMGSTYQWSVILTDNNGYTEAPDQTGLITNNYTIPTYISNLDYIGLSPESITVAPEATTEFKLYPNIYSHNPSLIPTACNREIKDSNGQTIATAEISEDGTILVTTLSVGVGELKVYAWDGQKTPYTAQITVSDDPRYRPHTVHTTINGNGQVLVSEDIAMADDIIDLTVIPEEGWWLASLYATANDGSTLYCYVAGENKYRFNMPASDATITAEFFPDSVPQTRYPIHQSISGTGTVSVHGNLTNAYATSIITITPTGYDDHVLKSLTVTDAEDNAVELTANTDGSYSFQMPASEVIIHALFAPEEGYAIKVLDTYACTVAANPTHALPDQYVIVSVRPDEGYEIGEFQINLWTGDYMWLDDHDIRFVMPAHDVEIYVYCVKSAATSGTFGDDLHWKFENETLTISGDGSMGEFSSTFDVPWNDYRKEIQTVVIKDGVTDITPYTFSYLDVLSYVTIPSSVEYIANWAFLNDSNLTQVSFQSVPVRGIESSAFAGVTANVTTPFFDYSWTADVTQNYGGNLTWDHSWSSEVIAPTCESLGYTQYTCICGDVSQEEYTVELGHDYTDGVCHRCGKQDPNFKKPMENPFTDVMETDWFYTPVLWAVESSVTGGYPDGTFRPNNTCTRAEVVTFLYAAAGKPAVTATVSPFSDVTESDWYFAPVMWAVENGITSGYTDNTFRPYNNCTRAEVVTFLYAAAGKPTIHTESTFDDVADNDWFATPVIWAKENDITGGISPTMFGPASPCNRAAVVTFLYKANLIQ